FLYYTFLYYHHSFPTRRSSDLSPSRFIMDLFPGSFNIREFNRTNYYWQDANNAYNEIMKLIEENQIPQEKIPVYFTKKFLQENKDRKSTRLNSSHVSISYAVFC